MKWQNRRTQSLSAEQAALIALDLTDFKSLQQVESRISELERNLALAQAVKSKVDNKAPHEIESDKAQLDDLISRFNEALELRTLLEEEISLANPYYYPENPLFESTLELVYESYYDGEAEWLDGSRSTVTRESLARWCWDFDKEIAKKFASNVEEMMSETSQAPTRPEKGSGPSAKTLNSQLKIIAALSEALIGGLTGIKNKDAEAILAALDSAGVERPVGPKTLGNYLAEAKKLS